eukprot:gene2025-2303_t
MANRTVLPCTGDNKKAPGNTDNDEMDADDVWEDTVDDSEDFSHLDLQNLIIECHDLLKKYHIEKPEKTKWVKREEESQLKILFGGLWSDGSGYTAGEEDEQISSYLSRIGRNEVITEQAWNARKIRKLAEDLFKRFKQTYQKKTKVENELQVKLAEHGISGDRSMFMEWKQNAVFNAKVFSSMATPVQLSKDEELLLLFMVLQKRANYHSRRNMCAKKCSPFL